MAVRAEAGPECGQEKCLSKRSALLPANLGLGFLMEGEEEGRGEKADVREIVDLATRQKDAVVGT